MTRTAGCDGGAKGIAAPDIICRRSCLQSPPIETFPNKLCNCQCSDRGTSWNLCRTEDRVSLLCVPNACKKERALLYGPALTLPQRLWQQQEFIMLHGRCSVTASHVLCIPCSAVHL